MGFNKFFLDMLFLVSALYQALLPKMRGKTKQMRWPLESMSSGDASNGAREFHWGQRGLQMCAPDDRQAVFGGASSGAQEVGCDMHLVA